MKGLCPPPEQGNVEDGYWIEAKRVERWQKLERTHGTDLNVQLNRGLLFGFGLGFFLGTVLAIYAGFTT